MDGFNWNLVDGDDSTRTNIRFSLIRNGEWVGEDKRLISFDYLDHEYVTVGLVDLEDDDGNLSEYNQQVWDMLLQVTNLDAT